MNLTPAMIAYRAKHPNELIRAQDRTGDYNLGRAVKAGKFQINRITFTGRNSTVTPLSDWLSWEDSENFCKSL